MLKSKNSKLPPHIQIQLLHKIIEQDHVYDAVMQNYNPIEYAVKHTREQIETR